MDLITQGILGAAVGHAGWRGKLGKGAVWAGLIFGLVPDFDVVSNLWGPWSSLVHHRGFTHSIFFAPLLSPLAGWVAWRLSGRKGEVTSWMHCIFWALLTHPLLDVFTTYGTQLLTPVSTQRFALDGVSIIDPMYTLSLLFALIAARRWREDPARGQRITRLALLSTTLYLALGFGVGRLAKERAEAELTQADHVISRSRAMPTFANLLVWRVIAEDERGVVHVGYKSVKHPHVPTRFKEVAPLESPLITRAAQDERVQLFTWFADDWVGYRVEEREGKTHLFLDDLRYGGMKNPIDPMWGARVDFDAAGELEGVERVNYQQDRMGRIGDELGTLWQLINTGRAE